MFQYLIFVIFGIILYLLLNRRDGFSIGSITVAVDLWRHTETGIYRLINRGEGGGFSPEGLEIIVENEEITEKQYQRLLEIIEEHPCEDPVVLFNEEDTRLARGPLPSVLECKINKQTKDSGCRTCSSHSKELAKSLQPLYDKYHLDTLKMAYNRLAWSRAFSCCHHLSDDIIRMIGEISMKMTSGYDKAHFDDTGNIHGGHFNIDVALDILSRYLSTRTGSQGGMDYATENTLLGLLEIIISLLRLGISSSKIFEILNKPHDSPDRIPLHSIYLKEHDIQLYILRAYLYAIDPVLVLNEEGDFNYNLTLEDLISTAHTISTQSTQSI